MADAVRAYTVTQQPGPTDETLVVVWAGLDADDTGSPIRLPTYNIRSVQIGGTFDTTTVTIEGSNDGVTYFTLNDLQGSAISKTAAALEGIAELTAYIRPKAVGGASTAITVTMLLSR